MLLYVTMNPAYFGTLITICCLVLIVGCSSDEAADKYKERTAAIYIDHGESLFELMPEISAVIDFANSGGGRTSESDELLANAVGTADGISRRMDLARSELESLTPPPECELFHVYARELVQSVSDLSSIVSDEISGQATDLVFDASALRFKLDSFIASIGSVNDDASSELIPCFGRNLDEEFEFPS